MVYFSIYGVCVCVFIFVITQPGIEPQSPRPLVNTLCTIPMGQ